MLKLWLIFASAVLANSLTIPLLIQPLDSKSLIPHGSITYNAQSGLGVYSSDGSSTFNGKACIGTENKQGTFECLAYGDFIAGNVENYVLHLDNDDSVMKLDYSRDPLQTGDATVTVQRQRVGPSPQLKEPIKLVDGKVPEPEVEKTFLQKYWIYLVPLVLLMMSGGGGQ